MDSPSRSSKWNPHRSYLTSSQRAAIKRRDGHRCVLCDSTHHLEVDHIIPVAFGGTDTADNLRTLCRDCHTAKTRAESAEGARRRTARRRRHDPYVAKHPGLR